MLLSRERFRTGSEVVPNRPAGLPVPRFSAYRAEPLTGNRHIRETGRTSGSENESDRIRSRNFGTTSSRASAPARVEAAALSTRLTRRADWYSPANGADFGAYRNPYTRHTHGNGIKCTAFRYRNQRIASPVAASPVQSPASRQPIQWRGCNALETACFGAMPDSGVGTGSVRARLTPSWSCQYVLK